MKRHFGLGFGLLILLTGCLPFQEPNRPVTPPPPAGLRPDRTSLDPLALVSADGTKAQLIDETLGNCPANSVDIPGEGSRVRGGIGGLAVAPNPLGITPVSPSKVGPQISAQAVPGTGQAVIIVVDDFNGNDEQDGVYFIDQQEGPTLAALQSGATETEVAALETNGQYSHGALVFNHTLALLHAADLSAADLSATDLSATDSSAVNQLAAVPSLRVFELEVFIPTERLPLVVPTVIFPRLGVTVVALDTNNFSTADIGPRLQATIRTLAEQRISRFAVNFSFGLVPCSVLADINNINDINDTDDLRALGQPDLTFEQYQQEVLDANDLDAAAFRGDLANILTTPVGTDPLLTGAETDPERLGAVEISYLAASGNYRLPYSLFPGYWSEFVAVSASNLAATDTPPVLDADYSNMGEVLMPGGYYTLTAYDPDSRNFVSYSNISIAGTSFAAPALSVFTALDFTGATPRCMTPDPASPLAFFKTDPPVAAPLPALDLPLPDALSRYCP